MARLVFADTRAKAKKTKRAIFFATARQKINKNEQRFKNCP